MAGDDRARVARVARLGEMCHHAGFPKHADRFQRQQFGIARADTDSDEFCHRVHKPVLASALTAAAAMALPPMRPCTTRNGTPCESVASISLASAAPTKPT